MAGAVIWAGSVTGQLDDEFSQIGFGDLKTVGFQTGGKADLFTGHGFGFDQLPHLVLLARSRIRATAAGPSAARVPDRPSPSTWPWSWSR